MHRGYIKLWRKIEDWDLYFSEPFTKAHAWIDMLMLANHDGATINVRGNLVAIKRGEIAWSEESLASRWKGSRGKVRRFLKWLETVHQTVQQKNAILSTISIRNYDIYHKNGTSDGTTDGHQTVQQTDTDKNDKNYKNVKKEKGSGVFTPPSVEEVRAYCTERRNGIDPDSFIDFYGSKGWLIGKNKMKDWRAAIRTWEKRDREKNGDGGDTEEKLKRIANMKPF